MLDHLVLAIARNAGGIYVTDDVLANPWDRLPNYWSALVERVATINADYNQNGVVDAADYVVWREMQQQVGAGLDADGNGDRSVDTDDLLHWRRFYGRTTGTTGAGQADLNTVPEPATLIVIAAVFAVVAAADARRPPTVRRKRLLNRFM
jgi:hypothetical protein